MKRLTGPLLAVCLTSAAFAQNKPNANPGKVDPLPAPLISVQQVAAAKEGDLIILDTRSAPEWEAIRLPGALLVPGATLSASDLLDVRSKDSENPRIVIVGQSQRDPIARKAAERAVSLGWKSIYLLDGGVEAWAGTEPSRTLLFAVPYDAPESQPLRVSAAEVSKVSLRAEVFVEAAKGGKFTLLDVRQSEQRLRRGTLPGRWSTLTPEEFVWSLRRQTIPKQQLLIADFDGQLIPWLLTYMKRYGITDSAFLFGGSRGLEAPATVPRPAPPQSNPAPAATPSQTIMVKP